MSHIDPWGLAKAASVVLASSGTLFAYATASPKALDEVAAITPSPQNALIMLIITLTTYFLKSYMPSEKKVGEDFTELKVGHRTLLTKIEDLAIDTRSHRQTHAEFRVELAEQIGEISGTLKSLDGRQDRMEGRLLSVEKRVGTGTFPRPNLPTAT